jgi:hypothetical protein
MKEETIAINETMVKNGDGPRSDRRDEIQTDQT